MEDKLLYLIDSEEDTLRIYKDRLYVRQDKGGKHGEGETFIADIKPIKLDPAEEGRKGVLEFVTAEGIDINLEFSESDNDKAADIFQYLTEQTEMYNRKSKEAKDEWERRRKRRSKYNWIALGLFLLGIYFAFIH